MPITLTQDDIKYAIYLYNTGKSQQEIANEFKCSQTHISNVLKKQNITCRIGKNLIYNDVDVTFFKEINNEMSAYFLGLLFADGCVQIKNNCYTMSIKLKKDDKIILEKFRDTISLSSPIKLIDNKYYYFRINQKLICEQLIFHGCVPNKSLILKFPTTVPNELLHHFIRGYSDGDGTIYKNKLKSGMNTIWKIISTADFCTSLHDILLKLGIKSSRYLSKPSSNTVTTTLCVGGNLQVEKLLDWIYKDAIIYLPRKHNKYLEFKNTKGQLK